MKKEQPNINIRNKKASFNYEFIDTLTCGVQLMGTEVKSFKEGKVSLNEAYCFINDHELFIKGMNIAIYEQGTYNNHQPTRVRKLLIKKQEDGHSSSIHKAKQINGSNQCSCSRYSRKHELLLPA